LSIASSAASGTIIAIDSGRDLRARNRQSKERGGGENKDEQDTVDDKKLKDVIESGRVRPTRLNNRVKPLQLLPKLVTLHRPLPRELPRPVPFDRVDLAVVGDGTEGLGAVPGGEGVGGEAGVDEAEVGGEENVIEVVVVCVYLDGRELTFVDNELFRVEEESAQESREKRREKGRTFDDNEQG
jgi:hypothetical protein